MSENIVWAGNGQINDRVLLVVAKFDKNGRLPTGYQFDFHRPALTKGLDVKFGRVVETGIRNEHKIRRNIAVHFEGCSRRRIFNPNHRKSTPGKAGTWARIEELLLLPKGCELPATLRELAKQHNLFVVRDVVNDATPRYHLHCNLCAGQVIYETNYTEGADFGWRDGGFVTSKPCITGGEGEYLICDRCSRKIDPTPDDIETWS